MSTTLLIYIVLVDALGFAGGMAKRGETVTSDQIGEENINRLIESGSIALQADGSTVEPVVEAKGNSVEPETLAGRLSVGIAPAEDYEPTDDEKAWISEIAAGVNPVPFDDDKVLSLTLKEINTRIEGFGGTPLANGSKKADAKEALKALVVAWFENQVEAEA